MKFTVDCKNCRHRVTNIELELGKWKKSNDSFICPKCDHKECGITTYYCNHCGEIADEIDYDDSYAICNRCNNLN